VKVKFVKKEKKRGGCLPEDLINTPKSAKIHRRHQLLPEHVRTISRNVDDFLEVERGDANRREFF